MIGVQFNTRRSLAGVAIIGASCVTSLAAADFSGPYAPANWSFANNGGNGTATNDGATLTIAGDNEDLFPGGQNTNYTIAADDTGTVSFNWSYSSTDTGTFDSGGYLLNGVYTVLAFNNSQGSGSISIPVNAGAIVGFHVFSQDGCCGAGQLTITNFSGPVAPPPPTSLSLEVPGACVSDTQVSVQLWARDLTGPVSGFQAFVEYDTAKLTYNGGLSSYAAGPFGSHIQNTLQPNDGVLGLDGNTLPNPDYTPPPNDVLLATLVFDVVSACQVTSVDFDLNGPFPSELSFAGVPIPTSLDTTGSFTLDSTAPIITCPGNILVAADVNAPTPICIASNCCSATGGLGCSDPGCTATICALDPFCCDVSWDGICGNEALNFCGPAPSPCYGAVVTFAVSASDLCDGTPDIVSTPPSGSVFPIGTTTVMNTATDDCGNSSTCTFDVTVTPTNLISVDADLVGSVATSRCIEFVTDDCTSTSISLNFTDHDFSPLTAMRASAIVEVPCGEWTNLCAKDEQHTEWDGTSLSISGVQYSADFVLSLLPGDTDNDGDIDIHDVTWLVFTFGDTAVSGGCAWNGTRDADFNNGGAVGSEDYSLMSTNFLTATACGCTAPATMSKVVSIETRHLEQRIAQRVDLNRDGVFDHRDVRQFEISNGLPETLSRKMTGKY